MRSFVLQYRYMIIGGLLGLLIAILLLTIGFFKTLLLLVSTILGATLGHYLNVIGFFEGFKRPRS